MNLLKNVKITRILATQADGQGTQSSAILDMAGFEGVMFIAKLADVDDTSVLTLQAQQNIIDSTVGMATLTGTATFTAGATDADDDLLVLDIYKPREQFLRAQLVIATANAINVGIIAIQYSGSKMPISQPATVLDSEQLVSPAEA